MENAVQVESKGAASILDKAVLVSLKLTSFGTSRKVKEYEAVVNTTADRDRVNVSKRLLDAPEITKIRELDGEIRKYVYSQVVPSFLDEGYYFLHMDLIPMFDVQVQAFASLRQSLVAAATDALESMIETDREKLGDLFNREDYPTKTDFREAYQMRVRYLSLSVPEALKAHGLHDRQAAELGGSLADAQKEMRELMRGNFRDLCAHAADRLAPAEKGKAKIFRDSMVKNINDFLGSFAFRNLTDDEPLAALVEEARALMDGVTAEELRTDESTRENTRAGFEYLLQAVAAL